MSDDPLYYYILLVAFIFLTGLWAIFSSRGVLIPLVVLLGGVIAIEVISPTKPVRSLTAGPLEWIAENPWLFAAGVVGYFVLGIAVAFVRWVKFVFDARRHLDHQLETRLPRIRRDLEKRPPPGGFQEGELEQRMSAERSLLIISVMGEATGRSSYPPKIAEFKNTFFRWASFWPFVGLWMIIDDPVRRFYEACYRRISGLLQAVSDKAFAGLEK